MITSTVSEVPVEFSIDPASRLPICRQLTRQIREAVARGKLQPEERLPSVRELSRIAGRQSEHDRPRVHRIGAGGHLEHAAGAGRFCGPAGQRAVAEGSQGAAPGGRWTAF